MCKKTVHLHIGSHKTATTTLQNTLAANADLLARAGLLYPQTGRSFNGHHPLALQLRDPELQDQPLESRGDWPALLQEIETAQTPHVLLSSENFEWLQQLAPLQALQRRYRVRVLFYMRSPQTYLESFYNQVVKDLKTRESRTLETYICEHGLFFLDNEKLLNRWSDAFGQEAVQVQLYEKSRSPEALLERFLDALGCHSRLPLLLPPQTALQKVSLPPDALEYLRLRNLHQAPTTGQYHLTMALAQIARHKAAALQRTRAGLLSLAAQRNLLNRFSAGNRRVARRYLGSDRSPFLPSQARAHAQFDSRLPQGDDVMISKVEALLSRFERSAEPTTTASGAGRSGPKPPQDPPPQSRRAPPTSSAPASSAPDLPLALSLPPTR
ncbi:hypothetical protein [Pseudophaeobacter sp.]|uniref:hypothetical protein n=1 Tax=Pseudophaeobacter sp. TaxID=1971739 RepID=UPI004058CBFE